MTPLLCWNCGQDLHDTPRPISRHATCGQCHQELHCCRLCRHYDPQRAMYCFEDRADPPLEKENANFCDFFSPSHQAFTAQTVQKSSLARDKLDDLFDQAPPEAAGNPQASEPPLPGESQTAPLSPEEAARRKLDDLFS